MNERKFCFRDIVQKTPIMIFRQPAVLRRPPAVLLAIERGAVTGRKVPRKPGDQVGATSKLDHFYFTYVWVIFMAEASSMDSTIHIPKNNVFFCFLWEGYKNYDKN